MATTTKALISTFTSTEANAYGKLIEERIAELKRKNAALSNLEPFEGTTPFLARKVLIEAALIPALEDYYTVGRAGKGITFIILCRAAIASASITDGSILSVIEGAVKKSTRNTPHAAISYGGEVVQFIDFDDSSRFLTQEVSQPAALSYPSLKENLIDSVIEFTAAYEGGAARYSAFNPKDGKAGVSFGYIQFNQVRGTLWDLMQEMHRRDSRLFMKIFGDIASQLLDRNWVKNINNNLAQHRAKFELSAQYAPFQKAQRYIARKEYWPQAEAAAKRLGVTTQRGYAILFDTYVQRPPVYINDVIIPAALRENSPTARLKKFAEMADTHGLETAYQRRRLLLTDSRLSDVALLASTPPSQTTEKVSNETALILMLEGRTGDALTVNQRNSIARILKKLSVAEAVPLSTDRIIGLDRLGQAIAERGSNPGENFSYLDLVSATLEQPPLTAAGIYKEAAPVTADAIMLAANALRSRLSLSRTETNRRATAFLQAYDHTLVLERANNVAAATRAHHIQGAIAQTEEGRKSNQERGATVATGMETTPSVTPLREDVLYGYLFDFATGLWNDGRSGGKVKV